VNNDRYPDRIVTDGSTEKIFDTQISLPARRINIDLPQSTKIDFVERCSEGGVRVLRECNRDPEE
jgi:hypothetical protein